MANRITVARIVLVPVFLLLAYSGQHYAALAVYIVACLSDMADGYIARRRNEITVFGKFMDPLADKILVLSAMCFFVEKGQMSGWVMAVVLMREFAVSGLRLIAAERGQVLAAVWSGKLKTACTMVGLCAMLAFGKHNFVNIISCSVILITTVFSGIHYFIRNTTVFRK